MVPDRQKYRFPKSDIEKILELGYEINSEADITLDTFMNKYFPNFNLLLLLRVVENQLTKTTKKQINRRISYNQERGTLKIEYGNESWGGKDELYFERKFKRSEDKIDIWHEYCILPVAYQGKRLIQPIFQESIQQYINMNANSIFVFAALNDGGYTWARHGFVAEQKEEVDIILADSKAKLTTLDFAKIKKIYDEYYNTEPDGKSFPIDLWASFDFMKQILRGKSWHGRLDLKDYEQLETFCDYVFR
jgi:hypothetical protein